MFRLHIDIPLGENEQDALQAAKAIMECIDIQHILRVHNTLLGTERIFQYRVSNDTDRRMNNYLNKDENGHVTGKKTRVELEPPKPSLSQDEKLDALVNAIRKA